MSTYIDSKYFSHPSSCILTPFCSMFSARAFSAYASTLRWMVGSNEPRMRAARRAALMLLLIPTVATGTPVYILALRLCSVGIGEDTPLGIWTMLYKLSTPSRELPLTGTPITGRVVWAAAIPGR